MSRPTSVVVSHQDSDRLTNPQPASASSCKMLCRSRLDLASRSSLVTTTVSPGQKAAGSPAPHRHGHHDFGALQSFQTADIFLAYVEVPRFPESWCLFPCRGCLSASMCRRRRRSRGLLTKAQLRQSANEADRRATVLPEGLERQRLVKWARMARVAADIDRWLSSPGLRPPT